MVTNPKISVITICFNAELLIVETMKSILNQTYQNIEYIVIDGGSTDQTLDVINGVAGFYQARNMKVKSEKDKGISDAMNKGILLANGEIITHLHAGDRYIDNTVIEKVMNSYCENQWRWGVAGSIVVDSLGKQRHIYRADADYRVLLKKNCIPHQSTFLMKDVFNKHGLFNLEYKQAMDYEYWLRIVFKGGERFMVLPFSTTYFLDGGKSSNIFELLKYAGKIRTAKVEYGCNISIMDHLLFIVRIIVFSVFYEMRKIIK